MIYKIEYVWFDTGLEYQATKEHLKFLEEKYGIKIKPYKAIKPISISCKQYGQPFISKHVSEMKDDYRDIISSLKIKILMNYIQNIQNANRH